MTEYIRRDRYLRQLIRKKDSGEVKIITGLRRCGKSWLLGKLYHDWLTGQGVPEDHIVSISPDGQDLQPGADLPDPLRLIHCLRERIRDDGRYYVFLDGLQKVPGFERTVNGLNARDNVDVYITGSNSKLLSGELATYLTGRYVEVKVSPFSFREFREAREDEDLSASFNAYLQFGGMPFLSHLGYKEAPSREYLEDLYSSIIMKDIVRRHKIRDVDLLARIMNYVLSETGHVFSAASILRYLKHERRSASFDTVMSYLRFGEEAFLFSSAKREDLMGRRILAVDEKFYAMDHAMRRAVVGGNVRRDIDRTLEAIAYRELLRRGYDVRIGRIKEKEVDFVCERGDERLYVQVAYLMESEETREREFSALLAVPDQFPKMVLSLDRVDFSSNGIAHRYLPEYLVEA